MTSDASTRLRLAVVASHPIQYQAPLFRTLAESADLTVFYCHRATPEQQAAAGFGVAFDWDIDLFCGYRHDFLHNVSHDPGTHHFAGCDAPEVGARLSTGRFDALLAMGWNLKFYWQAIFAAKRLGVPVLTRGDSHLETPRGMLKSIVKALAYPPLLRVFDGALYVGAKNRAYYERYLYPASRLHFAPHCVDVDWFAQRATDQARSDVRAARGIAPDAFVVLFAGKLVEFKRPLDLARAASRLRALGRPIEILVAGSGAFEAELIAYAREFGVALHLLGFCNQMEMPAAYAACDALALPSDGRESWGLVANEAIACGRPIIVSDACGCARDLASAGRVFAMGDIGDFAQAIDHVRRAPPASAVFSALSERYSLRAASAGILAACRQAISTGAKAAS
jgi:glycosyltransferase involved in cell wall biosynthesis